MATGEGKNPPCDICRGDQKCLEHLGRPLEAWELGSGGAMIMGEEVERLRRELVATRNQLESITAERDRFRTVLENCSTRLHALRAVALIYSPPTKGQANWPAIEKMMAEAQRWIRDALLQGEK